MRVLKKMVLVTGLAAALAGSGAAVALAEGAGTISVTGTGTVQVVPELATISLGVTTQGMTAAEAMAANSKALAAVIERLRGAGVADRDIQTTGLQLNPNWTGYDSNQVPQIAGYTAQNMLTVRARDLAGLGSVLDAAVGDGANTLNGLTFGLNDPRPAEDEARRAAVADASARAALLAEAAGVKLGPVLTISEGGPVFDPQPMFRADAAQAAPVPVMGGELGVTAMVTITWQLAQ